MLEVQSSWEKPCQVAYSEPQAAPMGLISGFSGLEWEQCVCSDAATQAGHSLPAKHTGVDRGKPAARLTSSS